MPDRRTRRPTCAATTARPAPIPAAPATPPIYQPSPDVPPEPVFAPDEHGALAIGLMVAVLVLLALLTIAIAMSV
jgi:hypothetical protein